jgi:hypothetical protein
LAPKYNLKNNNFDFGDKTILIGNGNLNGKYISMVKYERN